MAAPWRTTLRFTAIAGVGLGGWLIGSISERGKYNKENSLAIDYECECNYERKLSQMPGLPIFGTVSAASPIDKKLTNLPADHPSIVPSSASRVSQVI